MLRFLFRMIVIALLVGGVGYFLLSRWGGEANVEGRATGSGVGAAAERLGGSVDRERIREAGAELAETVAGGVDQAGAALSEARLTAKIKSKMALDDTLGDSRFDVDTKGTEVTVRGSAGTAAQRDRALQLARETAGVTSVVDRIAMNER
jgi:osmotically-inducible protein OsmY